MPAILYIDTSDSTKASVALDISGKRVEKISEMGAKKSQMVLPLIETLLKENNLELKDLTEIKVNLGPGSFTGLRVGLVIANTLGMLLKIPVNGQPAGTETSLKYEGSKYDK